MLNIGSLNIQGNLVKKLKFLDIQEMFEKFDIITLQESCLSDKCNLALNGYQCIRKDRQIIGNRRASGGVLVFYKNNLHRGINVYKSNFAGAIWLKLNKYFFSLNEDLYIACIYIAPYNSSSTENDADSDVFQILLDEIACYNTLGNIMLIGDMNSRTGQMKESLFSNSAAIDMFDINQNDKNHDIYEDFYLPTKVSKDDSVNTNGHKLLELLATCNMYIVNGRTLGDFQGNFTCHHYNGSSTIDLACVSYQLQNYINHFKVLEPVWYSDHCPIHICIKTNHFKSNNNTILTNSQSNLPTKYIWKPDSAENFKIVQMKKKIQIHSQNN